MKPIQLNLLDNHFWKIDKLFIFMLRNNAAPKTKQNSFLLGHSWLDIIDSNFNFRMQTLDYVTNARHRVNVVLSNVASCVSESDTRRRKTWYFVCIAYYIYSERDIRPGVRRVQMSCCTPCHRVCDFSSSVGKQVVYAIATPMSSSHMCFSTFTCDAVPTISDGYNLTSSKW